MVDSVEPSSAAASMSDAPPALAKGLDPLGAAIARAEMAEVAERRAARAAATAVDGMSDIQAARAIVRFLDVTARKLGMSEGHVYLDLDEYIRSIVMAAQGGKLDPGGYRCLWDIWRTLGQGSRQAGAESAAAASA